MLRKVTAPLLIIDITMKQEYSTDVSHLLPAHFPKLSNEQVLLVVMLAIEGRKYSKMEIYHNATRFQKHCLSYDFGSMINSHLTKALKALQQTGIVDYSDRYYQLSPDFVTGVAQHALSDAPFAESCHVYMESDVSWILSRSEIRYCLLTQTEILGRCYLDLNNESVQEELLHFLFEQDDFSAVSWDFLRRVDEGAMQRLLQRIPLVILGYDLGFQVLIDWFEKQNVFVQESMVYALVSALALEGSAKQIEQVVEAFLKSAGAEEKEASNVCFVADMLRGDVKKARQRGDAFKAYYNDLCGNKKKEMPYAIGAFYAVLLSFSGQVADIKSALTFTRASIKQFKDNCLTESVAYGFVRLLSEYLTCRQNGLPIVFKTNTISSHVMTIWANIMFMWEGQHSDLLRVPVLTVVDNPRLELEARASGLVFEREEDAVAEKNLKALMTEFGQSPLATLREPEPEWEDLLKVMESAKISESKKKTTAMERLVWRVDLDEIFIVPFYQKMQKAGWSKGRNIALRTLYSSVPKYATDTDIQIINCLKRHDGWYGVEYHWEYRKLLPFLVDHPNLFTEADPMLPVELKPEEVSFIIKEKNDGIHLTLSEDMSCTIVKDGDRRYKYLMIDDVAKPISTMMRNKGLDTVVFPKEEKARVVKALTKMSKRVAVRGDFDDPNTITIESKNTAVVRLQPKGEDLIASVLIKPMDDELTLLPGVGAAMLSHRSPKGDRIEILRKLKKERQVLNDLKANVPALAYMDENEIDLEGDEEILQFLGDMREYAEDVELQWPKGEKLSVMKVASMSDVHFSVTSQLDWFELNGNIRLDNEHLISVQELLEASAGGNKAYVKIDDKHYVKLKKDLRKRLSELDAMAENSEGGLKVHHLGATALDQVMKSAGKMKTDKAWQQNMKKIESLRDFDPVLPSNLQAELRSYQLEGYNWLSRLHAWGVGACLADDMGLGKTVQAIALLLNIASKGPSLVVAPSSVCVNWHKEVRRFAPVLSTKSLGQPATREELINGLEAFDILVVSYGLLQSNPDLLSRKAWNAVVLDEAHAIKNMQSIRSKAVMKLDAQFRLITTGTPIQNHVGELWNLFQFINPGLLGSYDTFTKKFVIGADELDTMAKRRALNRYIAPFILRRNKADVLDDLPSKTDITLTVEQSDGEKALYEALRQKAVDELEASDIDGGGHIKLLAQLSKLRMASCNPRLVEAGSHLPSSKMQALENLVDNLLESRHKALVFSQFTRHLALVKEMLDAKGVTYQYLDGSTSVKQREKAIVDFQSGKSDLFLISLKAGGVGLNLTAADYVIHMDPWWNPAVEDQASDRAHRIGQTRPVTVYRLVAEGTIEEKIVKLHHTKRGLADDLLAGTDKSAKISSTELFELMR